jgi:hypothetical protein
MDVYTDIVKLLTENGLTGLLLIYLIAERIGPPIIKKLYPDWKSSRDRVRTDQLAHDKETREDAKKTENRLFDIAESIVESNGKLNYTLEHMSSFLQGQSVFMREMALDIARIYTHLRIERNDLPIAREVSSDSRKPPHE